MRSEKSYFTISLSALSLTYCLQNYYERLTRAGIIDLTSRKNLSQDKLKLAVYNSICYLEEVTGMEAELAVTYVEAMSVIRTAMNEMGFDVSVFDGPQGRDPAHRHHTGLEAGKVAQ